MGASLDVRSAIKLAVGSGSIVVAFAGAAAGGWPAATVVAVSLAFVTTVVCATWLRTLRAILNFAEQRPRSAVRIGTLLECSPEAPEAQGQLFHLPPAVNE